MLPEKFRIAMFLSKKARYITLIILAFSFLNLSLASACMVPDWAPKADDCCVLPCKTVTSPELAKSFCNLSDQQRSLHAGPQLYAPAILVEDGLALIARSCKAPPPVILSGIDSDQPLSQPRGDLFILHRTLLL
ncbi:hypothetical protein [Candidatus Manganitrophus noduliformans]|uniref:Uncharacterized protein n=1 Tax=Candidatus Manganitrophus noduliformans TaxID=2606439 RepID=A0A7X6IB67_9BACT|nr:hypothetical protein [Candidatus Manganitrophus noduliformans]NKE71140.1 hypothetical protein [Candidatus Manganitrophus noduliformans]